ncbi:MAG TPA: hypothetical protein VMW38_25755 [Terriglobia bacterium]|nr:hypothetical protein [Terriglobia bacterium]
MHYSFRPSILLRNTFRSPASKIIVCRSCGEELTLTFSSFIFCQIVFVVTVIPCAIAFARLETLLVNSFQPVHQLSQDHPLGAFFSLWIFPTLIVTLIVYNALVRPLIEYKKAGS